MPTVAVRSVLLRAGVVALFALALAACGGGETPTATPTSPPPAPYCDASAGGAYAHPDARGLFCDRMAHRHPGRRRHRQPRLGGRPHACGRLRPTQRNRSPPVDPSSSTSSPRGDRPVALSFRRSTVSTTSTATMSRLWLLRGRTALRRWTRTPRSAVWSGYSAKARRTWRPSTAYAAQSSWVGITGDGTLVERGSGHQSEEGWHETLTELGATSVAG